MVSGPNDRAPDPNDINKIHEHYGGPNDRSEEIAKFLKNQRLPDDDITEIESLSGVASNKKKAHNHEFEVWSNITIVGYNRETTKQDVKQVTSVLDSAGIEYERVHRPDREIVVVETKHIENLW